MTWFGQGYSIPDFYLFIYLGENNTCPPWPSIALSVHWFPEATEGGGQCLMNERHWRTPKAVISDPPPTSQHRQKGKGKKKIHIPALKTEREREKESLRDVFPVTPPPSHTHTHISPFSSSFFYFDLRAEPLYWRYGGLGHNNMAYWEIKPLATWLLLEKILYDRIQ